jgi:hypothetical protein
LLGLSVSLAGARLAAAAPAGPSVEFERGRTAFSRAEYQRSIDILRKLLYPEVRLDSEGEVVQAHRMLGVANLFEGRPTEAKREFRKLLELRPDYRFDPLLDPPRVVDFFNAVLKEEEDEIAALEAKRKKREAELAARRAREADRLRAERATIIRYQHNSYLINFIPFGAGQFQNGQRRKGWTYAGIEGGLAAISLAAFSTNFAMFGLAPRRRCQMVQPIDAGGLSRPCPDDKIDRSDETLSTNLLRVQLVSGGLFFAVAVWGVIDAIRNYHPLTQLGTETAPPSDATAPPEPVPTTFHLRPTLPGLQTGFQTVPFGLGLEWTF